MERRKPSPAEQRERFLELLDALPRQEQDKLWRRLMKLRNGPPPEPARAPGRKGRLPGS